MYFPSKTCCLIQAFYHYQIFFPTVLAMPIHTLKALSLIFQAYLKQQGFIMKVTRLLDQQHIDPHSKWTLSLQMTLKWG